MAKRCKAVRSTALSARISWQPWCTAWGDSGPTGGGRQDERDAGPQVREDMATVFTLPPIAGETRTIAETVDSGHGRVEQRRLHTSDVLVG